MRLLSFFLSAGLLAGADFPLATSEASWTVKTFNTAGVAPSEAATFRVGKCADLACLSVGPWLAGNQQRTLRLQSEIARHNRQCSRALPHQRTLPAASHGARPIFRRREEPDDAHVSARAERRLEEFFVPDLSSSHWRGFDLSRLRTLRKERWPSRIHRALGDHRFRRTGIPRKAHAARASPRAQERAASPLRPVAATQRGLVAGDGRRQAILFHRHADARAEHCAGCRRAYPQIGFNSLAGSHNLNSWADYNDAEIAAGATPSSSSGRSKPVSAWAMTR